MSPCEPKHTKLSTRRKQQPQQHTQTKPIRIVEKNKIIKEVDVWLGNKPTINLIVPEEVVTTLSFEQINTIKSTIRIYLG